MDITVFKTVVSVSVSTIRFCSLTVPDHLLVLANVVIQADDIVLVEYS